MAGMLVTGTVASDGSIITGSGYMVAQDQPGVYTVTFNKPFTERPAVVITQVFPNTDPNSPGGAPLDNSILAYIGADHFQAITGNDQNQKVSRDFSFIAVGQ